MRLRVPARELAWYNPAAKRWEIEQMTYHVWVGGSSRQSDLLESNFTVWAPASNSL